MTRGDQFLAHRCVVSLRGSSHDAHCPRNLTGAIDVDQYTGLMRQAGFVDIQVVDKATASDLVAAQPGLPRVYSARITARKP
jgi:hypothetical protein